MNIQELENKIEELENKLDEVGYDFPSWKQAEKAREVYTRPLGKLYRKLRLLEIPKISEIENDEFGDHFTMENFIGNVECGGFINSDGVGYYANKDTKSNIQILPSDIMAKEFRKDFTHVLWYNK